MADKYYTKDLEVVLKEEKGYYERRRIQAAKELQAPKKGPQAPAYANALKNSERPPIGMAFSGGGIRSATFNLGILQGLSKFGILPWVDYLTSVSGGGFIASCLTSLLSHEEKKLKLTDENSGKEKRYYPFNTQWGRFPFNPNLQVFDENGVAYDEKVEEGRSFNFGREELKIKQSSGRDRNKQLEHLRNMGNYLIPRTGILTTDTMRGIGAFLLRITYTLLIYLAAMTVIAVIHYGIAAAFTPQIMRTFDAGQSSPYYLAFVSYNENIRVTYFPRYTYLMIMLAGLAFSSFATTIVSLCYRKDPTTENRLRPWLSPSPTITLYSYLMIHGIRVVTAAFTFTLAVLTGWMWYVQYPLAFSSAVFALFYFSLAGLFLIYFIALIIFILVYSKDEHWSMQGLPEQEQIDKLIVFAVVMISLWTITLIVAGLRLRTLSSESSLEVYWIWMPAVFAFGGCWGLLLIQFTQKLLPKKQVYFKQNTYYDRGDVGRFWKEYFRVVLRLKYDRSYQPRLSRGVTKYAVGAFSNPDFRSMFWTLQGLFLYGFVFFALIGVLLIPNYFSILPSDGAKTAVPLSATLISGVLASLISTGKLEKVGEWMKKILSLPAGLSQTALALLVFVLNFSVLFLLETWIDGLVQPFSKISDASIVIAWVFAGSLIILLLLGLVNANYLTAHYFYRDRVADAFLRTEVEDPGRGEIKTVRDDRDRLIWSIARDGCSAPYHIVITSLNMPGSWHLELKDRKSQPFILSRLYSGSEMTGYVRTHDYRNKSTKYSQAIALSGAAVSSSIGFLTFFAQAFMTTLLNLRLGLWLDNPNRYDGAKEPKSLEAKAFWPFYLWDEARGRTSERRNLINLTDGAHTGDNIGLYPLFQRRCRFIIACDAGEDPQGKCQELFTVIRQVNIDLGIEVRINVEGLQPEEYDPEKKTSKPCKRRFAIGKILYPKTKKHPAQAGWLIYLRPSVVEGDPAPILKYWERHKLDFPHPTTTDQFFDEEQFEIQRMLGEWTVTSVLKQTLKDLKRGKSHHLLKSMLKFDQLDPEEPAEFRLPRKNGKRTSEGAVAELFEKCYQASKNFS
jgi:hypothetical protein